MRQYYFTAASLPLLSLDAKPSITIDSFLATCELHLTSSDYNTLKNSSIKVPENEDALTGVAKVCWDWEKSLRNELVKFRSAKMGLSSEEFLRKGDSVFDTQRISSEAVKIESPLEAEGFLNAARIDFLDSTTVGHYFDLTFLVIYYLKLQIFDRVSNFDSEEGFRKYKEIYTNILTAYEADGSEI